MVDAYKENVGIVVPIICNPDGTIDQRVVYKKKFFALRMLKAIIKRQFVYCKEKKHQDLKSNDSIEAGRMLIGIQNNCYVVSGSIFLLTPGFFKHYNQLFPETFLYFEEWATMIYLHKAKLKTLIASTDTIIHMGGASTPEVIKNNSIMKRKAIASSSRKVFKLIFMSQNGISKIYNNTKWKECCYNDKENI